MDFLGMEVNPMPEIGSTITQKIPQLGRKAVSGIKTVPSQLGTLENLKKPLNAIKDGMDTLANPGYVLIEQAQKLKRSVFNR